MMIDPTAMVLADRATRRHVGSARPGAPVDRGRGRRRRPGVVRGRAADLLRRLADRLEPPRVPGATSTVWAARAPM